ncbi:MAG: AAA domain-containing protein [Spirosomataceae bacterium]
MNAAILKTYLRRLTNLSTRNRSLLLTNLPAEQFLDWQELDFADNRSAFDLLKDVLSQKKSLKLCPVLDSRSEKVNEISKRLGKIARTERFIEEERGSEDLYVAYPFVRGKLMDGTVIHAPLAFFSVTLNANEPAEARQGAYRLLHRRDEPASLNRSFLLAYGHFNQVKIPDELLEKSLDELSRDPLAFRTELYELLKESPLEINFNQDIFQDKLQYFESQSKPDLDLLERNGELKLYPEAVLGIFPQAGSYLGPDYESLIDLSADEPESEAGIFDFPTPEIRGTGTVRRSSEVNTFTAFPQDASQEEALIRVKHGESLVVQGPPGTGKSQLIANLMTDFAARGKRVLLVCQKRVALDVVHERLKQVDFTPFVALVHDFKNDRAALYAQLANQIENIEAYQKLNYSLDAIVPERQFLQTSRVIDQTAAELEEFKLALFDVFDCGLSPKELYLTSSPSAPYISLPEFRSFDFSDKLEAFIWKLNRCEQYQNHITAAHPWYDRVSFRTIGFPEIGLIRERIDDVADRSKKIAADTEQWLGRALVPPQLLAIEAQKEAIHQWLQSLSNETVWKLFKKRSEGFFTKSFNQRFREWVKTVEELKREEMVGDELSSSELRSFSSRLDQLIVARQSFFQWLFYSDKAYFRGILEKYGLTLQLGDLYQLRQMLQNRQKWESALQEMEETIGIPLHTETKSASETNLQEFLSHFAEAEKAHTKLERHFEFLTVPATRQATYNGFQKVVKALMALGQQTAQQYSSWQQYLTESQIHAIVADNSFVSLLKMSLDRDFDVLVEADTLKESLTRAESEVVKKLTAFSDGKMRLETLFQNSLRLAWLAYLEDKYPILRAVSSLKISQLEQELQEAIVRKQELSREILLIHLREQTYKDAVFNRLQNRTTYRELHHQVTKKRKIWPIRKLMDQHSEEIFRLIPCWLASPETVSAVFPLTAGLFDLVIFDEASQCYAEYGIPAIYRAQQTVIVGDSKQLTPYDLYRVRYEAENEEEKAALEVESLLDLAKHYLPETLLQGHYRSRSLDLIDFSNLHFYKNKLQLLPDFKDVNSTEPAIQYIKVEGVWENNRNRTEAEKVLELLQELQTTHPNNSVGIVTFNQPQQQLIENLLDSPLTPEGGTTFSLMGVRSGTPHGLFIKNIENVQGDERDIIIFSIGYAPDARGRLRSQFGSLNAQGGENRLNVAITRARYKVFVVTSIYPDQLQVEASLHEGPQLLKKYLRYALEVSEGRYVPQPFVAEKYRSEWLLKNQVAEAAQKVAAVTGDDPDSTIIRRELPFADLTVKNGDRYERVILTDDDLYQQAVSSKESHAYLPLLLRAKGWSFERIWSRGWWRGR